MKCKTSMHRMIVRYALLTFKFFKWNQSLAYNVDLTRFLVLCLYKWYLTNDGAKDGIIGNSDWYHASKVYSLHLSIIWQTLLSHTSYICICASFQSKLLAYMQGELMLPIWIHETFPNPFAHGKYAWASNMDSIEFSIHIFVKGLSSLTKKGEIESSSLVLVNR